MNKIKIKSVLVASLVSAGAVFGLSSCDKGTSPGETNVERSEIIEEGSLVESDDVDQAQAERDSLEKHYDHADHENHDDNKAKVIGDGAYDGKGNGTKRNEVDDN